MSKREEQDERGGRHFGKGKGRRERRTNIMGEEYEEEEDGKTKQFQTRKEQGEENSIYQ